MKETENKELVEKEDSSSRVYELGYLLVPTIIEEEVPVTYGNLKELIASTHGDIISDEMPKMITLSYSIKKVISNVRNQFNTAYFGWTKFTMDPDKVLELKKHLELDPNFIRFLILKTVKENTIATKRFVRGESYRRAPTIKNSAGSGEASLINKEEIDKEIDALIAV